MSAQFTVDSTDTTVEFSYTAATDKIQAVIEDCSESLFERGLGNHGTEEEPIVFVDLSNQDKLDIVDSYIKDVVVNMANAHKIQKAVKSATEVETVDSHEI